MGDMADDMRDAELEWYFENLFRSRKKIVKQLQLKRLQSIGTGWWRTRTEVEVEITRMDDTHLANVIAMLERNELTNSAKYRELIVERKRRKDIK